MPIGACSFISPFNFPLNLAAHKVAPALAVGCPFVLKPASRTPLGAIIIGEVLAETDLPPGAFSILPASRDGAEQFTTDPRLKLLSFTGSPAVGWDLKARAGKKKVTLELGGNAAVIVDRDADLDDAAARIVFGAFYQSGQSCIGVQRIIVHADVYDAFRAKLVALTRGLVAGNPLDEDTFIGPMIDVGEAKRLDGWIAAAVAQGATLLCGGSRDGAMLDATLLESVPRTCDLYARGGVRPGRDPVVVHPVRRRARRGQRFGVRAAGRRLHPRPVQHAEGVGRARGRRGRHQRRAELPRRQHALWRGQGLGAGARGRPLRDGGHERDPQPGHPPTARRHRLRAGRARMTGLIVAHHLGPAASGLLAGHPAVAEARAIDLDRRWELPTDVDVIFALHSATDPTAHHVPRPAGWPGRVKYVQLASSGSDGYPDWLGDGPIVATSAGTSAPAIAEFVLTAMLMVEKRLPAMVVTDGAWTPQAEIVARPLGTLDGKTLGLLGIGEIGSARRRARAAPSAWTSSRIAAATTPRRRRHAGAVRRPAPPRRASRPVAPR